MSDITPTKRAAIEEAAMFLDQAPNAMTGDISALTHAVTAADVEGDTADIEACVQPIMDAAQAIDRERLGLRARWQIYPDVTAILTGVAGFENAGVKQGQLLVFSLKANTGALAHHHAEAFAQAVNDWAGGYKTAARALMAMLA